MNAIVLLILIVCLIFILVKKSSDTSGIKYMLLGISIILVGGIIAVDVNSYLGGYEYLIVLVGLIFSIVGFGKYN